MRIHPEILRIPEGSVELDGSYGEGGGQIVRTGCALSALTGISCRITHIRRGRAKPGLRPQHVAALRGLIGVSAAKTTPLTVGATELEFSPGALRGGRLCLKTGTAGSIGLILQSLMIAGLGVPEPLEVQISGGTDVPGAPSCAYLKHVKIPLLKKMGYSTEIAIKKYGYIPQGGGTVHARLMPSERLHAITIPESNGIMHSRGISHASTALAERKVAEREKTAAQRILTEYLHAPSKIESRYSVTQSLGSSLVVWAETPDTILGASCLGRPNMSAEELAEKAARALIRTFHCGASLDPWMGDQILPYMALTGERNEISVPYITKHILTNIWVIEKFLNVRFYTEETQRRIRIICEPLPS